MRKVFIILAITIISYPAFAQWRKIADFKYYDSSFGDSISEYVPCIYFLDLPGPPRIGFAATDYELWKTSDAGSSWKNVSPPGSFGGVIDIYFKDSLTGWCVGYNALGGGVFETNDGGDSWNFLSSSVDTPVYVNEICYSRFSNRIFFTGQKLWSSTDSGRTWEKVVNIEGGSFAYFSDSVAIMDAGFDSDMNGTTGFILTSDGGETWSRFYDSVIFEPFAISGTSICFGVTPERINVFRSDDYGETWRQIYDFGPYQDTNFNKIGPYGTGEIRGDLNRLYIQSDIAMYVSTDEGLTWTNDSGPPFNPGVATGSRFYAHNGYTFAAMTYDSTQEDYSGGLWEEIWPTAGVAGSRAVSSSNSFNVFPNPANSSITLSSMNGAISIFDPLGRAYDIPHFGNTLNISPLPSGVYFVSDGLSRAKFVKE